MLKKYGAIFVLALLLLSIMPMAFADDAQEGTGTTETQNDTQATADAGNITNTTEHVKGQLREKVHEQIQTYKAKVNETREKIQVIRKNYQEVRQAYITERDKFKELKKEYASCKNDSTDACKGKRQDIITGSKTYLLNAADLVLKELENLKEKTTASTELTEEQKSSIIADLDAKIQEVTDARVTIENLNDNSTRQEVNDAAKQIRQAWQETKDALKLHTSKLVVAKLGNIIAKTETLETKLYNIRDKLTEKGKDVSKLNAVLDEFKAKVDDAKAKYEAMQEKLSNAKPSDMGTVSKDVHQLFTEAKQSLKDARDLLRQVVNEIKKSNNGKLEVNNSTATADEQ